MPHSVLPFLAGIALLTAVPAAAQADPVAAAVQADRAGDPATAISLLEPYVLAHPENADALRVLGSSYAHAGRLAQAIATLRRAQQLAPRDLDIAAALARALAWDGNRRDARAAIGSIAAADPGNAELPALRELLRAPAAGQRTVGIGASAGISRVSSASGRRTWRAVGLAADVRITPALVAVGSVDHEDRGTARDDRLAIGIEATVSPRMRLAAGLSATPDADFRERLGVQAAVEADVAPGATILLDARHLRFAGASTTIVQPGVRLQAPWRPATFTTRAILLFDDSGATRVGVAARGDVAFGGESGADVRAFAGAASYPDTEGGITRRMRSVYAGVAVPLSPRLIARLTVDHDHRRASYRRSGLSIGIGWRFGP